MIQRIEEELADIFLFVFASRCPVITRAHLIRNVVYNMLWFLYEEEIFFVKPQGKTASLMEIV